jgi:uncharacterized protein YjbI with pentapeptide repeats
MQIPELKKRLESEKPERCAWRDGADVCRTRGDLDTILHRHSQWLRSNGKSGDRANLTDAKLGSIDLDSADLRNAKLFHADLSGAYLEYAMLGGADLSGANLTGTHVYGASLSASHLEYAILTRADLVRANLTGAHLYHADLTNVRLFVADLTNAEMAGVRLERGDLERAKLHGVQLVDANLRNANLTRADLTGADLTHSNLSGAILVDTDLRDSGMDGARLSSALFEPEWNPPARSIASAEGLQFLTFKDKPDALVQLRKQFADGGFRTQERRITYALNRAEAELGAPSERHLKKVAFDLTCQYGMSPTRPLLILASLWFVMAFVYVTFMHLPGSSGIYRVRKREGKNRVVTLTAQIYVRPVVLKRSSKKLRQLLRLVRREWHLFRAAMFFSLMSASNIGFHEIDFGRWLRMLLKREYDLKAVGWARTVSGFQSLVSVYLLALWILTYFGRPFG